MMFLVSAVRGNPNFDCFVAVDIIAMFPSYNKCFDRSMGIEIMTDQPTTDGQTGT